MSLVRTPFRVPRGPSRWAPSSASSASFHHQPKGAPSRGPFFQRQNQEQRQRQQTAPGAGGSKHGRGSTPPLRRYPGTSRALRGVPGPPANRATSCALWGVRGLTLCLRCPTGDPPRFAQCLTGHPPRHTDPVHISKPRCRPPACHRRGRSPSIIPLATAPMVRRSGASHREATQKADGPGHHSHHLPQQPAPAISLSDQRQDSATATASASAIGDSRR